MVRKFYLLFILLLFIVMINSALAQSAKIVGVVKDISTGEPLPGANVLIKGTSIGSATDLDGRYHILRVPPGNYTITVMFIGYKTAEKPIKITHGQSLELNFDLEFDVIKFSGEVVVTAQQEGQAAAINQQIRSNTIVNVVSKDKIQELPDQNAAESLGRLPGISIQRSAGEGETVVVRGLSPRFSSVTVNGERLPGGDDRSVNLNTLSPEVLGGIEIFKALRPDLDADAIGGSINFITKKASEGVEGKVRSFGSYNDLKDSNYKGSIYYSNRFIQASNKGHKLGVVASVNYETRNKSTEELSATYDWSRVINGETVYETNKVRLTDRNNSGKRYNINISTDYQLGFNQEILFSSLYTYSKGESEWQRQEYDIGGNSHERDFSFSRTRGSTWSNSLAGNHLFWFGEINWRTSYSKIKSETPWSTSFNFLEYSAFSQDTPAKIYDPLDIPQYAKNDSYAAWLDHSYISKKLIEDRHLTGQLDIKLPFQLGKNISGYFKTGGKIRNKHREKDVTKWGGNRWATGQTVNNYYDDWFVDARGQSEDIALVNFIDKNTKKYEDFLNGDCDYVEVLDAERMQWFAATFDSIYKKSPYYEDDVNDYNGSESISAAYVMAEFNWKQKIMFMPGIRYERTATDYSTKLTNPLDTDALRIQPSYNDTSGNRIYENFLPMYQVRVKPASWFDIRLALTNSISRPVFYNLIPYEYLEWSSSELEYGNPNLKETTATNYDAYISFYNRFGLFSVGTFYKELENIDYIRESIRLGGYYSPYLTNMKGWTVTSPENLEDKTKVDGWEVELQTNFKYLPSPLDGILLYANFSKIHSESQYPYSIYRMEYLTTPPYVRATVTDTARIGRMIGQADKIMNITIGYEKGGFSGRLSMIYQGNAIRGVAMDDAEDSLDDDFIRWDLVMQQHIYKGIRLIAQISNLTNQEEKSHIRFETLPTSREYYGRKIDIGIQFEY